MKFANAVNNLVVKFIRLDFDETLNAEMLVMERIYPLDYRHTKLKNVNYGIMFLKMNWRNCIKQVLCIEDIKRTSGLNGEYFDNVLLTDKGLRLIDVGISVLREKSE